MFSAAMVLCLSLLCITGTALAQAGFEDDRVMLQGFYWESYRHGHERFPKYGQKKWYEIVHDQAGNIRDARFDLIWLPPPSFAGETSAGYNPKEYFNLGNSYGDHNQHRAMLEALLNNGVEPIADIVINHRDGSAGWTGFKNPDWGLWAITRGDEAFSACCSDKQLNPGGYTASCSEACGTPEGQRGQEEESPRDYAWHGGTTYAYDSFRDIDHTNPQVRRDIIRYLLQLKSLGYRGWRYDMVQGFHARWIAVYNKATHPTFSVGEYDWNKQGEQRGWAFNTATQKDDLRTASNVFDFSTYFLLKDNKGKYLPWYGFGNGVGLVGDSTDGIPWKNRAVTFIKNHDTGYRTHEDGSPQKGHEDEDFHDNWEVEQAYAQILTHPGVPTVFWKHFFDWNGSLREKIKALILARKVAGVHAGSVLHLQSNANAKGIYAARVDGRHGALYVRIGGTDADWQPSDSSYANYREYAAGDHWKVWVAIAGNPEVAAAAKALQTKPALPVPDYRPHETIQVEDASLRIEDARF
ncbi:MAG: alpha-amylase [Magnetococcales bacterium]|nr:alpha-amylase [Magnetococcales bacterium]